MSLLAKRAVESVSPAQNESGFYSRYFLVPKKDNGLRPILDLRQLNRGTAVGCGSFPAETDGNPHPELPRRLAHFGPVGGQASISQIRAPQPLRVPRTQGKFC